MESRTDPSLKGTTPSQGHNNGAKAWLIQWVYSPPLRATEENGNGSSDGGRVCLMGEGFSG
ncbi:hypothetical protein E2C01_064082 [Portunus trituberculatus]|uniref:Uncharacterized protein n=1 Tax=Portunus trituberculatus TaxID=210409 RepID=A0A5B7HAS7_PORTR|nr:hypothetical protein [Portunus trituberculatus]